MQFKIIVLFIISIIFFGFMIISIFRTIKIQKQLKSGALTSYDSLLAQKKLSNNMNLVFYVLFYSYLVMIYNYHLFVILSGLFIFCILLQLYKKDVRVLELEEFLYQQKITALNTSILQLQTINTQQISIIELLQENNDYLDQINELSKDF